MNDPSIDDPFDIMVSLSEMGRTLYRVGFAAGYAKAKSEVNREIISAAKRTNILAEDRPSDHPGFSKGVEEESSDNTASRAPYGSIQLLILDALRGAEKPMRPAAIHARVVASGYEFAKVETIRSTLHKMLKKHGVVKNTDKGWVAVPVSDLR